MLKYILCRFEGDREYQVMACTNLDSAREQGKIFKEGYSIYKTKLIEFKHNKEENK
jgi:hypothetical protein